MKKSRQIISLLLSVLMITALFTAVPFTADAAETGDSDVGATYSGTTGDCTWEFDPGTGIMTISGSGEMEDYEWSNETQSTNAPWWDFRNQIRSVVIGDGVTVVGINAFHKCENITSITLGNSVKQIQFCAFDSCSITSVEFPESLETIDDAAFFKCNLSEVILPDGVSVVGPVAFAGNENIKKVTVPASVTYIGDYAFGYINSDEKIEGFTIYGYPDTKAQTYAEENGFIFVPMSGTTGDCTWEFDPGTGIMTISGSGEMEDYKWSNETQSTNAPWWDFRDKIKSVVIGDGVTAVGKVAFEQCANLTSLSLGKSVKEIKYDSFYGCALTSLEIPDSVETIGVSAFSHNSNLNNVSFGKNVKEIGGYAFYRDSGLTEVVLPDGVESVGYLAFGANNDLKKVTIPASVTYIREYAFGYITTVEKIEGFTIYGYPDTEAQTYAENNGFTFENYVKKYDLWLGSTQVTEENMDDICGDGMAFYYPDSNALYLFDPNIQGSYSKGGYTYKIYSGINDLEINGGCTMETAQADIALSVADGTSIFGNHIFTGTEYGIYSNGDLNIYMGSVTGKGGTYGIKADGNITIGDSITKVEANGGIRGSSLTLGSSVSVTWPEDGVVENGTVTIGGIPVNYANFEASNTVIDSVSLNVPEPEAGEMPSVDVFGDTGYMVESVSWRDADNNEYVYSAFQPGHQYYVEVNLRADFRYEFAQDVNATINGKTASVKALNDNDLSEGICVYFYFPRLSGDIPDTEITQVSLNNVKIPKAGEAWNYSAQLDTEGCELSSVKLFLSGEEVAPGTLLKKTKYIAEFAVTAKDGYKFTYEDGGHSNLTGRINESSWTTSKDYEPGVCDEKHAVVQWVLSVTEEDEYDLWVGSTRVNYSNKDDILNDGGKAKFDPSTNTLTLNEPVITGYHTDSYNYTNVIYSDSGIENLTITGKCELESYSAQYGVCNDHGSITLNGDFVFSGTEAAVCSGCDDVTISGGEISLYSINYSCVACNTFTVTNDVKKLTINSNYNAIYASVGIQLGSELVITKPDGAYIEYDEIYDKNGELAKEVVIEKSAAPARKIGDVNGDNNVDVLDAAIVQKYAAGKTTLTPEQIYAGDVNGDNNTDVLDAATIQKYAAGKITEFKKKS